MYKVNLTGDLDKIIATLSPALSGGVTLAANVNGVPVDHVDAAGASFELYMDGGPFLTTDTITLITSNGYTYNFSPVGYFINLQDSTPSVGLAYSDIPTGIDSTVNTGLTMDFLLENGKFKLVGGNSKVQKNVLFFTTFFSWFRVYIPDYAPNIFPFIQKPVSFVQSFRTLLLGKISESFEKHIPNCKIEAVNTEYSSTARKTYGITITYSTKYPKTIKDTVTRIIQL
jgi:hypothetical protein